MHESLLIPSGLADFFSNTISILRIIFGEILDLPIQMMDFLLIFETFFNLNNTFHYI